MTVVVPFTFGNTQAGVACQLPQLDQNFATLAAAINNGPSASTFANLPSPASAGMMAVVTDSTVATFGATIAGGSTHQVLAWFNGTVWTVIGI